MKILTNIILLDISGSMSGQNINKAIEGLNTIVKEQEKLKGIIQLNRIYTFNHKVELNQNTVKKLKQVSEIKVGGTTALYDAIGKAIDDIPVGIKKGTISIFTDGEENSSRLYKLETIKEKIANLRKKGWMIAYVGVDEASLKQAEEMNISKGNSFKAKNKNEFSRGFTSLSNIRNKYNKAIIEESNISYDSLLTKELNNQLNN